MNYKEAQKLYPKIIRIPDERHAEYYIETLSRNDDIPMYFVEDFKAYEKEILENFKSIENYKLKKLDEIVEYLKRDWDVSKTFEPPKEYTIKEFGDFKEGKMYVSIDLRSANYTAWKKILNVNTGTWSDLVSKFGLHKVLSDSKSFRQFVFGNTHPRRLEAKQKDMMLEFLNFLPDELKQLIVARRNDEIIFELDFKSFDCTPFNKVMRDWYVSQKDLLIPIHLHMDLFSMRFEQSANERVAIKTGYACNSQSTTNNKLIQLSDNLFQIEGNRFFLHYKNLILKQPIDERDLIFRAGKHYAQWIV